MNSPVVNVSQPLGLGPEAVEGIVGRWVATPGDWNPVTPLETLGLDAMALTPGHGN